MEKLEGKGAVTVKTERIFLKFLTEILEGKCLQMQDKEAERLAVLLEELEIVTSATPQERIDCVERVFQRVQEHIEHISTRALVILAMKAGVEEYQATNHRIVQQAQDMS